jgi:hypothetical protein
MSAKKIQNRKRRINQYSADKLRTNPAESDYNPDMIFPVRVQGPPFRIEFMYKAHYMIISYRPELSGIWHCYGIPHGQ